MIKMRFEPKNDAKGDRNGKKIFRKDNNIRKNDGQIDTKLDDEKILKSDI